MQEELNRLLFLVSDQSLSLLPEYHDRIKVGLGRLAPPVLFSLIVL